MKLLVNLCSYDGISTHYSGVGTIIIRYIEAIIKYCKENKIDYKINLYTTESYDYTLGYNKKLETYHKSLPNINLFKVSNGSGGETNFGTIDNWKTLSKNTAYLINNINIDDYDKVITLIHDTPYCDLLRKIKTNKNHIIAWIPHSTVKIHGTTSDEEKSSYDLDKRYKYEKKAVDYINKTNNFYLASCGKFIGNHMIKEYSLNPNKLLYIVNGELLNHETKYEENEECRKLFKKIKDYDKMILSFGRAEKYKNLESTMLLGKKMNIKTVVIAQSYYENQPILKEYRKLAQQTNTDLFIDTPFSFPHYILKHFNKPIILLVPSKKEIMGLVINEIRKKNKNNILIVANDIDGLKEQINDGIDGLLVDLDNIKDSSIKIKKYLEKETMIKMNNKSQKILKEKYDFNKNITNYMNKVIYIN